MLPQSCHPHTPCLLHLYWGFGLFQCLDWDGIFSGASTQCHLIVHFLGLPLFCYNHFKPDLIDMILLEGLPFTMPLQTVWVGTFFTFFWRFCLHQSQFHHLNPHGGHFHVPQRTVFRFNKNTQLAIDMSLLCNNMIADLLNVQHSFLWSIKPFQWKLVDHINKIEI